MRRIPKEATKEIEPSLQDAVESKVLGESNSNPEETDDVKPCARAGEEVRRVLERSLDISTLKKGP